MAWFKRKEKGIQTSTEQKKDTPRGLWYKSPTGKIVDAKELEIDGTVSIELEYSPDPDNIEEWVTEAYEKTDALMQAIGLRG